MKITEPDLDLRKHAGYHSFLLRYWKNRDSQEGSWLLSLENPITREIKVFHTVESLSDYLTQLSQKTQVKHDS